MKMKIVALSMAFAITSMFMAMPAGARAPAQTSIQAQAVAQDMASIRQQLDSIMFGTGASIKSFSVHESAAENVPGRVHTMASCTVTLTVGAGDNTATVSATAPTCAQAMDMAMQAAKEAVARLRDL